MSAQTDLLSSLDPWQAAKDGLSLSGRIALTRLPRVAEQLFNQNNRASSSKQDAEELEYHLEFRREHGRTLCVGHLSTRLRVQCQRCLGGIEIPVDTHIRLALMPSALGLAELPEELDAVEVIDQQVRPGELIEDELLLAIPVSPRHPPGECEAPPVAENLPGDETDFSREERPNPFAVLRQLTGDQPDETSARATDDD